MENISGKPRLDDDTPLMSLPLSQRTITAFTQSHVGTLQGLRDYFASMTGKSSTSAKWVGQRNYNEAQDFLMAHDGFAVSRRVDDNPRLDDLLAIEEEMQAALDRVKSRLAALTKI